MSLHPANSPVNIPGIEFEKYNFTKSKARYSSSRVEISVKNFSFQGRMQP